MTNAVAERNGFSVNDLRLLLARHAVWAMWLVAATLLMKVAVPSGYMPVISGELIVLELCSGYGPEQMMAAMPGMADHHRKGHQADDNGTPCGFGGHAPAAMASIDPVLLVAAIAFIIGTLFQPLVSWPGRRVEFLRPQLRGPPRSLTATCPSPC